MWSESELLLKAEPKNAVGHAQRLCLLCLHTEFRVKGAPSPNTCHIALLFHLPTNSPLQPAWATNALGASGFSVNYMKNANF